MKSNVMSGFIVGTIAMLVNLPVFAAPNPERDVFAIDHCSVN